MMPDYLKRLRAHMSWRQTDLAAYLGCHRVTVAKYESGEMYPPFKARLRLNDLAREEGFDAVPRRDYRARTTH